MTNSVGTSAEPDDRGATATERNDTAGEPRPVRGIGLHQRTRRAAIAQSPAQAASREGGKITGPFPILLNAQFMQVIPGEYSGIVTIIEHQPHGVMPDRLDRANPNVLLATEDGLLIRSMPLNLGRGTFDPQILGGQSIVRTVIERDVQHPARLDPV